MTAPSKTLSQIGDELVKEARARPQTRLPLSTELFPHLLVASRSMSLREISVWLAKNQNVKLSAAAISRALNQPKMHLQRLAEEISAQVRYLALACDRSPHRLLFQEICDRSGRVELDELVESLSSPHNEEEGELFADARGLQDTWKSIPYEVRKLLTPYLTLSDDEEGPDESFNF